MADFTNILHAFYANLVHKYVNQNIKFMQNIDLYGATKQDRVIQVPHTQF